jgi:molybdate transport system substrate-binding protein
MNFHIAPGRVVQDTTFIPDSRHRLTRQDMPMRRLLLALGLSAALGQSARAQAPVTVFAAASLKGAMGEISQAWVAQGHPALRVSLDSSGTLAKQIHQGAPAEIFISADEKWMDYLAKGGEIVPASRKDLLTNTLVMVAPADHARPIKLERGFDLAAILGPNGRLAVGDTASVPAGIYAKQALTKLGAWDAAAPHLAPAENVKAALVLVETGEAPAGIVYATDVQGDAKVKVIGTFPASSHDPITYPIALIGTKAASSDASAALAFIESQQGKAIFAKYGFGVE